MTGYDASFLGPDDLAVPLPAPRPTPDGPGAPGPRELRHLDHPHFTVLLDPVRRLAAATACTIDGARLRPLPRSGTWRLDPQAPAAEQAGPELYARNPLDRGHLVRRLDPMWGTPAEARAAGQATFVYSNAAPQVDRFNQSKELWNGLEDHVLAYADAHRHRVVVHTGCAFDPTDPVYRGVALPRRFWKVAAWATLDAGAGAGASGGAGAGGGGADAAAGVDVDGDTGGTAVPVLRAAAFVLDQSPQLDTADLRAATARALAVGEVPPLGPFRTFQVPVADVESLTGLDLGPLVAADVLAPLPDEDRPAAPLAVGTVPTGWSPVATPTDLTLTP
ncbi:endonuclease G [Isoptericola jiangsuensis]|uniref:Endonuclease G n=1 Tax=Isoptericola jiangsuensis TaxID=548579 RepID=A0A2A9F2P8_9MICO|nr:DNA/RNA non-specific endonuclease [Isoptericola jiangsuensis]PFG44725.1 endonuclease G [Isoptericola jiangsuensis]